MESYIIGTISLFAGTFVPEEFLECNGAALDPVQYQVLFNVIGTKFGGDGVTSFNLPTLAPPVAGVIYMICLNGSYPEMSRAVAVPVIAKDVADSSIIEEVAEVAKVAEEVEVAEVAKVVQKEEVSISTVAKGCDDHGSSSSSSSSDDDE